MNFNRNLESNWNTKFIIGGVLAFIIVSYGLFEAYDLLRGPSLTITSPRDGQIVRDSQIKVEGNTKRVAKVFITGRQIFAQADGSFKESLLLGSGYNIIEVKVEDQFGRKISKSIGLVLE